MAESDLFALLEIMLRTFAHVPMAPRVKPGGHPEEIFLNLSEEEKEDLECNICYQILKDVRQCENKHKFCHSCIYVWSTSGSPVNHSRCPVCRVEGLYARNYQLNEKIDNLQVKCNLKTCKWKGPLKIIEEHDHITYQTPSRPWLASTSDDTANGTELPLIRSIAESRSRPVSNTRERGRAGVSQNSSQPAESASTAVVAASSNSRGNHSPRRKLLSNRNSNNNRTSSVSQRTPNSQGNSSPSARARSQSRVGSSQRRAQAPATTVPTNGRLTSRARIRNGVIDTNTNSDTQRVPNQSSRESSLRGSAVTDENSDSNVQTTTQPILSPRPPSMPRAGILRQTTNRRLPALPDLVSTEAHAGTSVSESLTSYTDNYSNFNQSTMLSDTPRDTDRRGYVPDYVRRADQTRSFGTIRERLNESRQRLDSLMSTFSSELDRGRQDLTSFQVERERRRQEQMSEVRDLGRRLTQVANELRGLLTQRREIRAQIDTLADVASDDMD